MIKNKKILLTGGYGFFGNHIYKSLKKKNNVRRIGRYKKNKKINLSSLKKNNFLFDAIIHCAGGSSVSQSIIDPKKDYEKTVKSTKALINYIKFRNLKTKLIFISSASVYGNSISKKLLKPISPYGKNKLEAERILIEASKKLNFDLIIIRYFSLYGEGLRKQLIWDALNKLNKKIFIFNGTGKEKRSWMHVDDAVKIIHKLFVYKNKKIIINAAGKQIYNNKKVISMIFQKSQVKEKPIFNKIFRKGDPKNQVLNNDDLNNINFKQSVDFSKGLNRYIRWFKRK